MPLLRVNAGPNGPRLHNSPASLAPVLVAGARGAGPVIVMVHGFKYDPDQTKFCPHRKIFAHSSLSMSVPSWPQALGIGSGDADEGLAVAFGWRARGALWQAQKAARIAGQQLADVVRAIKAIAPHRPLHVITHSMGSEVLFEALHHLPAHSVNRMITLTGASYQSRAEAALDTPAGRTAELINVTSRENDVFDVLFETLTLRPCKTDRALGCGIRAQNAVTLEIDCPATLRALRNISGPIAAPQARCCHWSAYTRPGIMAFYNDVLRRPTQVSLQDLQRLVPDRATQRWARLLTARPCVKGALSA